MSNPTRMSRVRQALRAPVLRSIPWVLFGAVFLPAVATTAVGIVILALGDIPLSGSIALGVLTICFAVFVVSGAAVTLGLILRQNKLARLQTEFIANASHELRTPLTSIRMYVETLRLGRIRDDADREACLAALEGETERLSDLVERLLGFRAASADTPSTTIREIVGAERALRQAVAPFELRPADGERISLVIEPDLPELRLDRVGFEEAISNLVQNGLTHGGAGGQVVIGARPETGGVAFEVRDSGPGVPEQDLGRVFDRFHRAATTTESKIPGFGLGLSIVKQFADRHDGRVGVRNAPGSGAVFTLWLPALTAPLATPGAGVTPRGEAGAPPPEEPAVFPTAPPPDPEQP